MMSNNPWVPLVSIVITCYNYAQYLSGCIESVLAQTYKNYEVVVVDDGSTDNTFEIAQPYCRKFAVRYVRQENEGQASAKNRGIKESKGEFIAFLDADDQWEPDKLSKQIPLFAIQEVGVVYSRFVYIDNEGKSLPMEDPGKFLEPRRGKVTASLIYDNFIPFSSVIVRRVSFEASGVFDESLNMGIDWDLWLRLSTRHQFDFCEEPFLLYRIGHSNQMSKNLPERIRCADRIIAKFQARFPGVLPRAVMEDAAYYSYCLRGYTLRKYGLRYPFKYYLKAIFLYPLRKKAYLGLLMTPLRALLGR